MKSIVFAVVILSLSYGCATHRAYDTSQFRQRDVQYEKIALNKDGLTREQIKVISSTKPPKTFPVDISLILLKNGYINSTAEDIFVRNIIKGLSKSRKIKRVTVIPDFLVAQPVSFNTIQELGVRSLSEYVVVFYLDARELFTWTKIIETQYEINSAIAFILVDSYTSAMLTSDKLYSTQKYKKKMFALGEQKKAQETLFSEQAALLGKKINRLFGGRR